MVSDDIRDDDIGKTEEEHRQQGSVPPANTYQLTQDTIEDYRSAESKEKDDGSRNIQSSVNTCQRDENLINSIGQPHQIG